MNLLKNLMELTSNMPHTNQLIEEFKDKCNRLSNMGTTGINTGGFYTGSPEAEDWHLSEDFMVEWLIKALSQTEQECDKKWKQRIETEKDILLIVLSKAKHERNRLIYEEKIETLDDLLNNK